MKLLICLECNDLFNLDYVEKICRCGATKGKYNDEINAIYSGDHAIPLGISNFSIMSAIKQQPKEGLGKRFEAFVIPKECPTFKEGKT